MRPKTVHRAKLISADGVSPLCAPRPRAINLAVATWTIVDAQVACRRCLAMLRVLRAAATPAPQGAEGEG